MRVYILKYRGDTAIVLARSLIEAKVLLHNWRGDRGYAAFEHVATLQLTSFYDEETPQVITRDSGLKLREWRE